MNYNLTDSKKIVLLKNRQSTRLAKRLLTLFLVLLVPIAMLFLISMRESRFNITIFSPVFNDFLMYFGTLLLATNILFLIYMLYLVCRKYKEFESVSDELLPSCVVIMPAFNEGKQVFSTLQSILNSNYAPDKLEIVAVDDGSKDDTFKYISEAAATSNGRIKAIKQPYNQGKRAAIYAGIKASKGDVIITIDSDSIIDHDTLRKMVSPFVYDVKIGGVAGNVRVLNLDKGIIPKMLEVNFLFSFEFIRAAQSAFRGVFCSPGALSAFRRSVIINFLDEWVNQKFFGKPSNIGEDRAMTNMILSCGYDVVFQKSAMVLTIVPENYSGLCKMLIRWARSNVRENMAMLKFIGKYRFFDAKSIGIQINLFMQLIWMVVPVLSAFVYLYCMIASLGVFIFYIAPVAIIFAVFPACLYLIRCGNVNALLAYIYAIFYFSTLFWIAPYAIFTFYRSGWLTRKIRQSR